MIETGLQYTYTAPNGVPAFFEKGEYKFPSKPTSSFMASRGNTPAAIVRLCPVDLVILSGEIGGKRDEIARIAGVGLQGLYVRQDDPRREALRFTLADMLLRDLLRSKELVCVVVSDKKFPWDKSGFQIIQPPQGGKNFLMVRPLNDALRLNQCSGMRYIVEARRG